MRAETYTRDVGYLLNKAARRWNTMFVEALSDRGITDVRPSFGAVLVPLFREDGLRLGELAERGGLSKQTVTSLVKRLEDLGYVERRADPEDGRAMRISLTDRGHRMKQAVRESVDEVEAKIAKLVDAQEFETTVGWLATLSGDTPGDGR
jgi:DNA-binding MarR family transcriptional regulator